MSQQQANPTTGHTPREPGQAPAPEPQLQPQPASRSEVAADLRAALTDLLERQCAAAAATAALIYLADSEGRKGGVIAQATWPPSNDAPPKLPKDLLEGLERIAKSDQADPTPSAHIAGRLAEHGEGEAYYGQDQSRPVAIVPLIAAGAREGSSALLLPGGMTPEAQADTLEKLGLIAERFQSYLWEQRCIAEARQRTLLRETLELIDAAQQGPSSKAMGGLLCHELARRFGATRVSIGLVRGDRIRVEAVSSAEDVDKHGLLTESIEAAMEEVAAQDTEVVFPQPPEAQTEPSMQRVTRACENLSERFGPSAVLGLPLRVEGDLVGVALLERDLRDPFPIGSLPLLRLVAEYTGPALWTRRLADRGIAAVTRDRVLDLGSAIVGPRHTALKLVGLLLILVFVLLAAFPIPDRITAETSVRAAVSRTIVPPYTGYLRSVEVEPGDAVAAGDVLALMDTSELELTLAELRGRMANISTERDNAASRREMAQARQLSAQAQETQAQIDLLLAQLGRASIKAPIAGVIGRGDLTEYINARVDPTQPLFELVTPERVLVLQVDERSVGDVQPGDTGRFASAALPGRKVPFVVERVNPVAEATSGKNVFLVEAVIDPESNAADDVSWLRPGMSGTAKINDGITTGLAAIAGPLVDRVRMWLWF